MSSYEAMNIYRLSLLHKPFFRKDTSFHLGVDPVLYTV